MDAKPIAFADDGRLATRELLRQFDGLRHFPRDLDRLDLRGRLETLEAIDRQYGGTAPLALEDVAELLASILVDLSRVGEPQLVIGAALWGLRHGVPIEAPEPVINALAERSNRSDGKEALAAILAIMHALADNVAPRLSADLERSNPERAWRILHVNLAITAIRTEEAALMDKAFDALDRALPGESGGFYAEALALALAPRVSAVVRERIEARIRV